MKLLEPTKIYSNGKSAKFSKISVKLEPLAVVKG